VDWESPPLYFIPARGQKEKEKKSTAGGGNSPCVLKIGSLNVRGCSTDEGKRCEIGSMCERRKLDVLALSETKMKGKGEAMFGNVKGRISGVMDGRAREGVALLLSDRVKEWVVDWKEVSSRVMWVKVKLRSSVWVFVGVYAPGSEKSEEERESFWNELTECLRDLGTNVKVVILGDMNARVGVEEVDGIVGKYGVPGTNASGEHLVGMCAEHELVIGNTCFKKKEINKYTWVRMEGGNVRDRAVMDYVLVSRSECKSLLDVHVYRGEAGGMSDHFLVEGRLKVSYGSWKQHEKGRERGTAIKVGELRNERKMMEYQVKVANKYECLGEIESVEEEWSKFKNGVVESAREICGVRKVGGKRRKGSEWWNDVVREAVGRKRRAYEGWLNCKNADTYEVYKEERRAVKQVVKEEKRRANERWCRNVSEKFDENKKMFWKEVKKLRKGNDSMEARVRDVNGNVLCDDKSVKDRWKEYFDMLLNEEDGREANVVAVGNGRGMPNLGELNDERISRDEICKAVSKLKDGKATGMDGCAAECVKKGGATVIEWLVRLFNVCFLSGVVPSEWCEACIVPLYKGKGDKYDCGSYRGISLLSVIGKLYGRVLIDRISGATECAIGEEQCGFRRGRGCVDQVFAVRQVCEKAIEKGKEVFFAFMDLEKAYDRVDRGALWDVMRIYGVGGRLLRGVQSFYASSRACVRVADGVSDWFSVNVGLRQGCVMSPWLFNLFMDGVVREVNARMLGRGCEMVHGNETWHLSQLLFADDTALVADSEERLSMLVKEFGRVCDRRKLNVNVGKSKVMRCANDARMGSMNVVLKGQVLEEVNMFKYLGSNVSANGGCENEVVYRLNEGAKVLGVVNRVVRSMNVSLGAKRCLYERVVVPTVLYGAETWALRESERKKLNVFEMKCLRSMIGVSRMDRVRNELVRERTGVMNDLAGRVDRCVLRWFGHVERMNEERMVKRVMNSSMSGRRPRGRPKFAWMNGVKRAVNARGMSIEDARVCATDRVAWRALVSA